MNLYSVSTLLTLSIFSLNHSTNAQSIITDRPDQTESSSTIPKNSFQIESGLLFGQVDATQLENNRWSLPTTLLRYGICEKIEIRIANSFTSINHQSAENGYHFGFSDLELGTKIQLLRKANVNTEIAFLTHIVFPFGDKRISNVNYGSISKLSISHSLSESISLGYNLGYNYFGVGSGVATYSLVLGFGITEKLRFYIEPFGEWVEFESHAANLDGGFTYLLQPNIQLDISYGVGLNYHMHYASVGFSMNIGP